LENKFYFENITDSKCFIIKEILKESKILNLELECKNSFKNKVSKETKTGLKILIEPIMNLKNLKTIDILFREKINDDFLKDIIPKSKIERIILKSKENFK
jgi:hypothetical protein